MKVYANKQLQAIVNTVGRKEVIMESFLSNASIPAENSRGLEKHRPSTYRLRLRLNNKVQPPNVVPENNIAP